MTNKNIQILNQAGQSIWYDNLSRDVLENGELAGLIGQGVSGLTSNPTIFQKAISGSDKYDNSIRELLKEMQDVDLICEDLMVQDVGAAADLLLPAYKDSNSADGYASIEVSPFLADDTAGTLLAAQRLWKKLNRPNIMIKIPATKAGIPAIKETLAAGINVNVTLIFSVAVYREVAQAFIEGLEERVSKHLPINNIASVASFFVSRVDAICEKELQKLVAAGKVDQKQSSALIGQIGIANSIVAYQAYQELFLEGSKFKNLQAEGAQVQRPLWASTGTKNPEFDPLLYVKALGIKDTVNTLPPATLNSLVAAKDCSLQILGIEQSKACLEQLNKFGVQFEDLLQELQEQGVKSFADSFSELLSATREKLTVLR